MLLSYKGDRGKKRKKRRAISCALSVAVGSRLHHLGACQNIRIWGSTQT